jgi:hypothetical protein
MTPPTDRYHVLNACVLFVLLLAALPAEAVTLRISVELPAELPGLPRTIRVLLTNTAGEPVTLPVRAALQDAPSEGKPFIAYSGLRGEDRLRELPVKGSLVLAPGETRDVSFWASAGDGWFEADRRLLAIGTHRVQLVLGEGLDSVKLGGVSRIQDQPGLGAAIVSNETTYTVLEPKGADLAVWNLIQEKRQGTCAPAVTEVLWRDYPDSRYAAYCPIEIFASDDASPEVTARKQIAALEAALAKNPDPLRADWLRLRVADSEISLGWALHDKDMNESLKAYGRAQVLIERLLRDSVPPQQAEAAALRPEILTRDFLVKLEKASKGIYDQTIKVRARCAELLSDGRYSVWFGHTNETPSPITVPKGPENRFTPPPFDRGQPALFPAGIHTVSFRIVTAEPHLTWHLQKKTVLQVKPAEVRRCPEGFDPADWSTWEWP